MVPEDWNSFNISVSQSFVGGKESKIIFTQDISKAGLSD
jgi:hypothetical protein